MSDQPDNSADERDPDETEDPQAPEGLLDRLARKDRAGGVHKGFSAQERQAIAEAHKEARQQQPPPGDSPNHINTDVRAKFARLDRDIADLWAMIRRSRIQTAGGTLEEVALTLFGGTGGDATTAANFTYTFTDSTNATHTNVSPAHQRLNAAKRAFIGIYNRATGRLIWTDEIPDAGGCS